ncbi:hypothetical protein ACT691_05755 [Vibrio metschnikovii]
MVDDEDPELIEALDAPSPSIDEAKQGSLRLMVKSMNLLPKPIHLKKD